MNIEPGNIYFFSFKESAPGDGSYPAVPGSGSGGEPGSGGASGCYRIDQKLTYREMRALGFGKDYNNDFENRIFLKMVSMDTDIVYWYPTNTKIGPNYFASFSPTPEVKEYPKVAITMDLGIISQMSDVNDTAGEILSILQAKYPGHYDDKNKDDFKIVQYDSKWLRFNENGPIDDDGGEVTVSNLKPNESPYQIIQRQRKEIDRLRAEHAAISSMLHKVYNA